MKCLPIDRTTLVPFPLLRALVTNRCKMEVEPESQEMPLDEFGVAKANHALVIEDETD